MRILVVRHGQTSWNVHNKVCGRTDVPLTEEGLKQARQVALIMKEKALDVIVSSPLQRAIQMSRLVSEACGVPVEVDERLIELNFGIYEGVDRADSRYLENKRHFAYRFPGGESMMKAAHRVYGLLEELKEKYPNKTVLLVCHGGICRMVCTYFEDMTNEEFFHYSPENAAIQEYSWED